MSQKTEVIQEIIQLVQAINDCWLEGRYDELESYFHDGMVLAMPGFEKLAKIDGDWRVWWRTVIPGTSESVQP